MKSKSIWFFLIFGMIAIVFVVGCRGQFPAEKTPLEIQYQNEDCNSSIKLVRIKSVLEKDYQISGISVVSMGEDIYLDLENHSNRTIQFPPDGGSIYYMHDSDANQWVVLENRRTNMNTDPELLLPNNSPDYLTGFYNITPKFPWELDSNGLIPFRVVVVGNFISSEGETQEIVCATYDLFFEP